jgi:predicted short-subunit dehydrogenase-like oxidoreductase (DUF2520 family)
VRQAVARPAAGSVLAVTVVRVVGPGRAGGALGLVLAAAGWRVAEPVRHGDDPAAAAAGVDVVVIATPDAAVAEVAGAVVARGEVTVVHLAGSLGLDVLAPHEHRAAVHPLTSLPDADTGARRLRGAWFATAASTARAGAVVDAIVGACAGRTLRVADADRAAYHAAACIASNHLVGLLGQVERVAATVGVPLEAYLDLVRATVENVAELGPAAALTGPAARGDEPTLERHRGALAADERPGYEAGVALARRLVASPTVEASR